MHWLGLVGMPRRVYTYPAGLGWELPNLAATLGSLDGRAASVLLFVVNVVCVAAARRASPATIPGTRRTWSGPPARRRRRGISRDLPVVNSRDTAMAARRPAAGDDAACDDAARNAADRSPRRDPATRWGCPDPSIWPLLAALALTVLFIWSIFSPWGVVWGAIPIGIALTVWFWPKRSQPSLGGANERD